MQNEPWGRTRSEVRQPPSAGRAMSPLRWAPSVTVAAFALPIAAGLLGTWLPAFGVLPAIGDTQLSLAPWHELVHQPGFATALQLTLVSGLVTTLLAVLAALGLAAWAHERLWGRRLGAWMAP